MCARGIIYVRMKLSIVELQSMLERVWSGDATLPGQNAAIQNAMLRELQQLLTPRTTAPSWINPRSRQ
jgi:hypothetical protein